jgi:hypothetical protein
MSRRGNRVCLKVIAVCLLVIGVVSMSKLRMLMRNFRILFCKRRCLFKWCPSGGLTLSAEMIPAFFFLISRSNLSQLSRYREQIIYM